MDDIGHRFTYHSPKGLQPQYYNEIRARGREFAFRINELCPDGREKSLAITKLEECVMWANASIAREK